MTSRWDNTLQQQYDNAQMLTGQQFGGSVAEATLPIRMQFIRKVYAILTVQLLLTTALSAVSFFSQPYKNWIQSNQWAMWVSLFGAIGFMLLTFWKRKSYPMNLAFLGVFTAMEVCASNHLALPLRVY